MRRLFGRSRGDGPDYSHVDSKEKAEELVARGELTRLHLLPPEFGGADVAENLVFVPPFVVDLKHGTDMNIVRPLIEDGSVSEYSATPSYKGDSFVPASIEIHASNPGDFHTSLEIWG
jgi:hypothetical protein